MFVWRLQQMKMNYLNVFGMCVCAKPKYGRKSIRMFASEEESRTLK